MRLSGHLHTPEFCSMQSYFCSVRLWVKLKHVYVYGVWDAMDDLFDLCACKEALCWIAWHVMSCGVRFLAPCKPTPTWCQADGLVWLYAFGTDKHTLAWQFSVHTQGSIVLNCKNSFSPDLFNTAWNYREKSCFCALLFKWMIPKRSSSWGFLCVSG